MSRKDNCLDNAIMENFFSLLKQEFFHGKIYRVMISPEEDEKGTLIELKDQGCRDFESLLVAQGRSWFDFFKQCEKENVHYKRIDLAINDKVGFLSIPYLAEKCRRRELASKFRSFQELGSGKFAEESEEQFVGTTLYIGSLKSDIYFCFYEKNIEQMIKKGMIKTRSAVNDYSFLFRVGTTRIN